MKNLRNLSKALSKEMSLVVLLQLARESEKKFSRDDLLKALNLPRGYIAPVHNALVRLELANLIKTDNGVYRFNLEAPFGRPLREFLLTYASEESGQ